MFRRKRFRQIDEEGGLKDANIKLLEYFENQLPGWIRPPPTGILNAYYDEDLEKREV